MLRCDGSPYQCPFGRRRRSRAQSPQWYENSSPQRRFGRRRRPLAHRSSRAHTHAYASGFPSPGAARRRKTDALIQCNKIGEIAFSPNGASRTSVVQDACRLSWARLSVNFFFFTSIASLRRHDTATSDPAPCAIMKLDRHILVLMQLYVLHPLPPHLIPIIFFHRPNLPPICYFAHAFEQGQALQGAA